jgi:hypothetical protein|uniref:Uncharacterized protein n=1 Tax=Zea mays TaxID=4577 RepID=B6U357_MAIZE|nr:hypothetical protein [Zea mays]
MHSKSPEKQSLLDEGSRRNPANNGSTEDEKGDGGIPWLTFLGFVFLTFNSGMAIYRSDRDPGSIAFVSGSYVDLLLLFLCLRLFERTPPDSPRRGWIKACVWGLTTLLTVMFSQKVAAIMPPLLALVVWAMAFATIGGGFYAFFIHKDKAALVEAENP